VTGAVRADPAAPATRIAMWSGPRTVSTALLRAWENRPDTVVTDEPLYAFYLDRTGIDHPARDAVIASQPTDWRVVLARLAGDPLPPGVSISYAKHMTHHLLPEVDRAALAPLRHAHLIRDRCAAMKPPARLPFNSKIRNFPKNAATCSGGAWCPSRIWSIKSKSRWRAANPTIS
jgi:hypothetical protein